VCVCVCVCYQVARVLVSSTPCEILDNYAFWLI